MSGLLLSLFETYLLDEEAEMEFASTETEEHREYFSQEQSTYPQGFFSSL